MMVHRMTLRIHSWPGAAVSRIHSLMLIALLFLPVFSLCVFCSAGDESGDDFTREEASAREPPKRSQASIDYVIQQMNQIFDQRVFGKKGPNAADLAISALDPIVSEKLKALDRQCNLTDAQKDKLIRASRRDLRQLSEKLSASRTKFGRDERQKFEQGFRELTIFEFDQLRFQLRHGPFGEESFFEKVRQTILTEEQISRCEQQRLRLFRSNSVITAENLHQLTFVERRPVSADCFEWDRHGNRLGMLEYGKTVEIFTSDGANRLATVGEGHELVGFDFSPNENQIAIADRAGSTFVVNIATGQEIEFKTEAANAAVRFSPNGQLLATTSGDKAVTIWSVETGNRLQEIDVGEISNGMTPEFSPDGTTLVSANRQSATLVFDVGTGKLQQIIDWKPCCDFRFDPTGKWLALGFRGGNLLVCNPRTGSKRAIVKTGLDDVMSLDWSSEGSLIATAGVDGAVTLWKAHDLTRLRDIEAPERVVALRFNPSATRMTFAGGSNSKAIRYIETWAVPE